MRLWGLTTKAARPVAPAMMAAALSACALAAPESGPPPKPPTKPAFVGQSSDQLKVDDLVGALEREKPETCGAKQAAFRQSISSLRNDPIPGTGKAILVNLPAFEAILYEDGRPIARTEVIIGTRRHQTPEMSTSVSEVTLNPTWTVPDSIVVANELRPDAQKNPGKYKEMGFTLLDRNLEPLAWEKLPRVPPSVFVQGPGPANPLGGVKFKLAAGNAIYLHDTNRPSLFDRSRRAFSHGCVRVDRADRVTAWMLDAKLWDVRRLAATGATVARDTPSEIAVRLAYLPAWPTASGVELHDDIYGRLEPTCSPEHREKRPVPDPFEGHPAFGGVPENPLAGAGRKNENGRNDSD